MLSCFRTSITGFFSILALFFLAEISFADNLEEKAAKLESQTYCVNANFESAWESTLDVLKEWEVAVTLADKENRLITTAFIAADTSKLQKISKTALPFSEGRFTLKIILEPVTDAFTRFHVTLQIRQQKKLKADEERLLKTRGTFEKFLAFRVNQLAVLKQFPELYELRLGFDLVPNMAEDYYELRNVETQSPAGEAGFLDGDRLVSIGGKPIHIEGDLFPLLLTGEKEKVLVFEVMREERHFEIPLTVFQFKDAKEPLGMQLYWDANQKQFVIAGIQEGSRAEKAGLEVNDILAKQADIPLDSWTHYFRALAHTDNNHSITFEINRAGKILSITV